MDGCQPSPDVASALEEILGYLNYSSGATEPKFLQRLNRVYGRIEGRDDCGDVATTLSAWLHAHLDRLASSSPAFQDVQQARAVLKITFDHVLPAYREHHRDLLFHQRPETLFRPFFLGRVFEAVLRAGPPWDVQPETARRVSNVALSHLNDFIGYRPVAVLETEQRIEPYSHERVAPIPLYIAGAGVAVGTYHDLVEQALVTLRTTDATILDAAGFDPQSLDELCVDPRAYDFNHPVNKRPNYHFGQWDPHHLDNRGRYRRFVLQQVTLDALLDRVELATPEERPGRLIEAAAVLAGTILMASGTSGGSPESYDSSTSLTTLLPRIAAYRDAFYAQLLDKLPDPLATQLRDEAARMRQPLAGARQYLNQYLARRRAAQLQHVTLALLFARMGYPDAAMRQARSVAVASARMLCEIQCRLTAGFRAVRQRNVHEAAAYLPQIEDLLRRGIECGAIVDPWNILGFGGHFSIFQALENSVPDTRIDELIDLMEEIFALYSRVWSEAAAVDESTLQLRLQSAFAELTGWWDQFAAPMVSGIKRLQGSEILQAAEFVAGALRAWNQGGASAGDIGFWRERAEQFDSPKAYARVVEALLQRGDLVGSMALLMNWVGRGDSVPLEDGDSSFHTLAERWMHLALHPAETTVDPALVPADRRVLVRKFFDYLEANAEVYWEVPQIDLLRSDSQAVELTEDEDDEDLFGAAYEDVTYRDSTADGNEGETLESGPPTDYELEHESKRLAGRLTFLTTVARLWRTAVLSEASGTGETAFADRIESWLGQAHRNRRRLGQLLKTVQAQIIQTPSASQDSLVEFDRRRLIKESLLEKIIGTSVATWDAERIMRAVAPDGSRERPEESTQADDQAGALLRDVLRGDASAVRARWPAFLAAAGEQPLLYVSLSRGGDPLRVVTARAWQRLIRQLLSWLPRLGMLRETCQLIRAARLMEREHPLGPGAVTEFDRLYEIGFKAIVESIVESSQQWTITESIDAPHGPLIECLRQLTEALLAEWLTHSRTLRLSALEKVSSEREWQSLVEFIQKYGHEVFTQKFLNLGNLRAIRHQGVGVWLQKLSKDHDRPDWQLLDDLEGDNPPANAQQHISLVIEAVVENYSEYRDYNSTTTQSDRGEMLYMLLDFLRLKSHYERVNWNLRPVVMTHQVLIRQGQSDAAEVWRSAMAERTAEAADQHLQGLVELQAKHGMRLSTVADRLAERFVRPLTIDRVQALVLPAIADAREGREPLSFELLEAETADLATQPAGAGFELPDWLASFEEEVERATSMEAHGGGPHDSKLDIPMTHLTADEIEAQLTDWEQRALPNG